MAWSVRLEDERGKSVTEAGASIEFQTLANVSPTGLLRYVDPYGDTIFNCVQIPDFIHEWVLLRPDNPIEEEECSKVLAMAKRCEAEPHLYLRFVGD